MPIPTEPIGSIPRPPELVAGMQQLATGRLTRDQFARLQDAAIHDTIRRFEATESPGITGYPREAFLKDLVREAETDIRRCLAKGAHVVQLDFTEGRLAVKFDPSLGLLRMFVDLNNQVLERFTADERRRIGVHTCPGGDRDSTHSADVDYA